MGVIPGGVDPGNQPPMTVPLRHFVVGLGFLLAGTVLGTGLIAGWGPGLGRPVHVHLLLVGWVCITIMGAMTQFVPVWSGVTLHSRRLATLQLGLVVVGLIGFAGAFLLGELGLLVAFGTVVLAGFWTFVYNVGRTLVAVESLDVTERHFAVALGFFVLLTAMGVALALEFRTGLFPVLGVSSVDLLSAHATIAVFGAVLTTIYGALYQLATMFTGTELRGIDHLLEPVEEVGHPLGVVLLAAGRLLGSVAVARIGAVLVLVAALCVAVVLGRKLYEMQVPRTPMHSRYVVVTVSLALWALVSMPAWVRAPLDRAHRYGADGSVHLLVLGVIGFVVIGTLYHIVPFIVWVHRYSDQLGFGDVPMVDDLYDDRIAAVDGSLLAVGTALLVGWNLLWGWSPLAMAGGLLVVVGVLAFTANVLLVIHRHSPHSIARIVFGGLVPGEPIGPAEHSVPADRGEEHVSNRRAR